MSRPNYIIATNLPAALTILPASLDFGIVGLDSSSTQTVQVINTGGQNLAGSVSTSGQPLADYGFPYFQAFAGLKASDASHSCLGFAGASDRAAALKKWRQWSAAQKK